MKKLKKRNEIETEFKWKIEDLIESDSVWEERYKKLVKKFMQFDTYKKLLTIDNLAKCLNLRDEVENEVLNLYIYANLKKNEDSTNSFYQSLSGKADGIMSLYQQNTSFLEPKILTLNEDEMLKNEKLSLYKHYLQNLLRGKKYILTEEKEELIAKAYEIIQAPKNIFSMINNADSSFGKIKNEKGEEVELTNGNYRVYIESKDREVRKSAFKSLFNYYYKFRNTISTTYTSSVNSDIFKSKVRNHESSIKYHLFGTNIPIEVYKNLIEVMHKYLPKMHKYIALRKKCLSLDEIHFYDLYTPIVKDIDTNINFDDAKKTVLEALKPLGEDYIKNMEDAFNNRWIDVYENKGKRSGAYVWGAYGTHPFVSLNYNNNIDNMFTLAHEMGHAMHNYYTNKNQPYVYGNYTIFLAEVASTVNEALLMEHLLKTTKDETKKAYLLNYFLEQFRTTVFRQTMFAEFEMIVHNKMEEGISQTFESLCEIYKDLNKKYYGDDIVIDDEITYEWLRIPHFYNAFYVYQYATGYSCAMAFSKRILDENKVEEYLGFLKAGSSDYSTEILKKAGVDMTKKEPIEDALDIFSKLIQDMENILK